MRTSKQNIEKSSMDFLKHVDFFGYKFNILYKRQSTYKTQIGGFASILSLMVSIASLLYFAQNFINGTNPRISFRQIPSTDSNIFKLNNLNSVFGFRIQGLDPEDILSDKYFKTQVSLNFLDENFKEHTTNLSLMNCSVIQASKGYPQYAQMLSKDFFSRNLCINLTLDTRDENIPKTVVSIKADQIMIINLKMTCGKKNSEGDNCIFDDNFNKKLNQKTFSFIYLDTSLNFDNRDDPFSRLMDKDFMFIDAYMGKFLHLLFTNVAVESDFGILFSNYDMQNDLKLERLTHNYMLNNHNESYDKNDINIMSVSISFTGFIEYHKRVYYKLQHVFAEVGGIINGILLLGRLSVLVFSKTFFYENFINDYFHDYLENEDLDTARKKSGDACSGSLSDIKDKNDLILLARKNKYPSNQDDEFKNKYDTIDKQKVDVPLKPENKITEEKTFNRNTKHNNQMTGITNEKIENRLDIKEEKEKTNNVKNFNINIGEKFRNISKTNEAKVEYRLSQSNPKNDMNNESGFESFKNENEVSDRSNFYLQVHSTCKIDSHVKDICDPSFEDLNKIRNMKHGDNDVYSKSPHPLVITSKSNLDKNNEKKLNTVNNISTKLPAMNMVPSLNEDSKDNFDNKKIYLEELKNNKEIKLNQEANKYRDSNVNNPPLSEALRAIINKKVNITSKSLIYSLLCPSKYLSEEVKKNNQALTKFSNKVNNLLELDSILRSHKNIELIKTLFFNEKQRLALNYVRFEFADAQNEIDCFSEIEIIKEYFSSKQHCLNEQDTKILEVLNKDLFNFIHAKDIK